MKKNSTNNIEHILNFLGNAQNEYYLWGTGETGQNFYQKYKNQIRIKGFIDSGTGLDQKLFGLPVFAQEQVCMDDTFKCIITIQTPQNYSMVKTYLLERGMIEHISFINYKRASLGLDYIASGKVSILIANLLVTNRCVLNCKDCCMQIPEFSKPVLCAADALMKQIDLTFQTVDYCEDFQIAGGEPLLHPDLAEIILYTYDHYKSSFGRIVVITNGTILPSEKLLKTLRMCHVHVEISDYSYSADSSASKLQKLNQLKELLQLYGVSYAIRRMDAWYDVRGDGHQHTEEELIQTYEECSCTGLAIYIVNNRLYTCTRCGMAEQFGLDPIEEDNSLKLDDSSLNVSNKKNILEYCMKICKRGYLPRCLECTGETAMFERSIPAAIQVERS